jgi:uncharacterized protein YktA (UPF0223 family)
MEKSIIYDIANESVRYVGELPPGFAEKLCRRIKRKYNKKVMPEEMLRLVKHFKDVFSFAYATLPDCINRNKVSINAKPGEIILRDVFLEKIKQKYNDDTDILELIAGWAIFQTFR